MPRHSESTCSTCGFTCSSPYDLPRHIETHYPSSTNNFPCWMQGCNNRYRVKFNLNSHLRKDHKLYIPYTRQRPRKYTSRKRGTTNSKAAKVPNRLARSISPGVDALAAVQQQFRVFSISAQENSYASDSKMGMGLDSYEQNIASMPCAYYTISNGYQSDSDASDSDFDSGPTTPIDAFQNNMTLRPEPYQAYNFDCIDPQLISPYPSDFAPTFTAPVPAYSYQQQAKQWIPDQTAIPSAVAPMYGLQAPVNYGKSVGYSYVQPDMAEAIPCDLGHFNYTGQGLEAQQLEPSFTPGFDELKDEGDIFSYLPDMSTYDSAYYNSFNYNNYVDALFSN